MHDHDEDLHHAEVDALLAGEAHDTATPRGADGADATTLVHRFDAEQLERLDIGCTALKMGRAGQPHAVHIRVDFGRGVITHARTRKYGAGGAEKVTRLSDVTDVQLGQKTKAWARFTGRFEKYMANSLSLICAGERGADDEQGHESEEDEHELDESDEAAEVDGAAGDGRGRANSEAGANPRQSRAHTIDIILHDDDDFGFWSKSLYFAVRNAHVELLPSGLAASRIGSGSGSAIDLLPRGLRQLPVIADPASTIEEVLDNFGKARHLEQAGEQEAADPSLSSLAEEERPGQLLVAVLRARDLRTGDLHSSDPLVRLQCHDELFTASTSARYQTSALAHTLNPVWAPYETFAFSTVASNTLTLVVEDWNSWKPNDFLGKATVTNLIDYDEPDGREIWLELTDAKGRVPRRSRGQLQLWIRWVPFGAPRELPNELHVRVCRGRALKAMDAGGTSDPYAVLSIRGEEVASTEIVEKTCSPVWDFECKLPVSHVEGLLTLDVYDQDPKGREHMGRRVIPLAALFHSQLVKWWVRLGTKTVKGCVVPSDNKLGEVEVWAHWSFNRWLDAKKLNQGMLRVGVLRAVQLKVMDSAIIGSGKADPYCVLRLENEEVRTSVEHATLEPMWHQHFKLPVSDVTGDLLVTVMDEDAFGSDEAIGRVIVPLAHLTIGERQRQWFELLPAASNRDPHFKFVCAKVAHRPMKLPHSGNRLGYVQLELLFDVKPGLLTIPKSYLTPHVAADPALGQQPHFSAGALTVNIDRILYALGPLLRLEKNLKALWRWDSPKHSCIGVFCWYYACYHMCLWQAPLLMGSMFLLFGFVCTPTNADLLTPWKGKGQDVEEEEPPKHSKKRKLKKTAGKSKNPFAKIREIKGKLAHVQVKVGEVASKVERLQNAVSWTDPTLTSFVVLGVVFGMCAGATALYFFPAQHLFFLGGLNKFIKGPKLAIKARHERQQAKTRLIIKPTKPKTMKTLLRRIPDVPELVHRNVCSLSVAEQDLKLGTPDEPFLTTAMDEMHALASGKHPGGNTLVWNLRQFEVTFDQLVEEKALALLSRGKRGVTRKFTALPVWADTAQMVAVTVALLLYTFCKSGWAMLVIHSAI
eukprot:g4234.t1